MDNCPKFIADYPVNTAEFFTAITYAATELYISMHVLDLENQKCNWPHERTAEETTVFGFTDKTNETTEINDKIYKDSLTQVMNRKYFDDKLASQNCQAVVMADIDFFKDVNDNYGHQCGDAALAAVASILSTSVRNMDRVVRYGGDEFLITFKGINHEVLRTRLEQMRAKAEKIKLQDYIF